MKNEIRLYICPRSNLFVIAIIGDSSFNKLKSNVQFDCQKLDHCTYDQPINTIDSVFRFKNWNKCYCLRGVGVIRIGGWLWQVHVWNRQVICVLKTNYLVHYFLLRFIGQSISSYHFPCRKIVVVLSKLRIVAFITVFNPKGFMDTCVEDLSQSNEKNRKHLILGSHIKFTWLCSG